MGFTPPPVEDFDNAEPECPCVLLLDTSSSMAGDKIDQLNAGLCEFMEAVKDDDMAQKRVSVTLVTFGGKVKVQPDGCPKAPFTLAREWGVLPRLEASGRTPLGKALEKGLELVRGRTLHCQDQQREIFRPLLVVISDGEPTRVEDGMPTDDWKEPAKNCLDAEKAGEVRTYCFYIKVEPDDEKKRQKMKSVLGAITTKPPMEISGDNFKGLFKWLSKSMQVISSSIPGKEPEPETPPGSGR